MTTYNDLTQLLRDTYDGDSWGNVMEALFESAGHMHARGLSIPATWLYSPGAGGDGTDPECIWYEFCKEATDDALVKFATMLERYSAKPTVAGRDY